MEIQNGVEEYVGLFNEVRKNVNTDDLAIALVEQIAKDRRTELLSQRANRVERRATWKQRQFLKSLGVNVPEGLTSFEASKLIEEAKPRAS